MKQKMLSVGHFSAKLTVGGERRGKNDIHFFYFLMDLSFSYEKKLALH